MQSHPRGAMEEHSRQRDRHVQRHRDGRQHGPFKGMAVSSIREENGKQGGGHGRRGREMWLDPITKDSKSGLSLDFTKKTMWSPKSAFCLCQGLMGQWPL